MTERSYRQTKRAMAIVLSGVVGVMNISGLSYISVGEHVYLDLSMIPAAMILVMSGYRASIIFGLLWGTLGCFTHPLSDYESTSYILTLLSQVVFSLSIVYAKELGYRLKGKYNIHYVILFAIIIHSVLFDFGVFAAMMNYWHEPIPFFKIAVKIILTSLFSYMSITLISKQLHQVHLSNGVKRSNS